MALSDFWAVVGDVAQWLAIPTIIGWALYDRRRLRNEARAGEAEAEFAEEVVPHRIKTSSIITLEAEIAALHATFTADRKLKQETIDWLTTQLENERSSNARKDAVISGLEDKVRAMNATIEQLGNNVREVETQLSRMRTENGNEKGY